MVIFRENTEDVYAGIEWRKGTKEVKKVIDWFNKNYVDKTLVESFDEVYGVSGDINELRESTNLHDFPLMINITAKFPVAPKAKIYGTGGVGVEVLIINYRNIENPDDSELKGAFVFKQGLEGMFADPDIKKIY